MHLRLLGLRVLVRMPFESELSISLLHLSLIGSLAHTQDLVVVLSLGLLGL